MAAENHREIRQLVVHAGRVYFEAETMQFPGELGSVSLEGGTHRFESEISPATFSYPVSSDGPLYYIRRNAYPPDTNYRIEAHLGPGQPAWQGPKLGSHASDRVSIATVGPRAFFGGHVDQDETYRIFAANGASNEIQIVHEASYLFPSSVKQVDNRPMFVDRSGSRLSLWTIDTSSLMPIHLLQLQGDFPNVTWTGVAEDAYWVVARHSCDRVTVVRSTGLPGATQQRVFDLDDSCPASLEPLAIHQGSVFLGGDRIVRLDLAEGTVNEVVAPCQGCSYARLASVGDSVAFVSAWGSNGQPALFRLSGPLNGMTAAPILHNGQPVLLSTYPPVAEPLAALGDRILTNCQAGACSTGIADNTLEFLGDGLALLDERQGVTRDGAYWYFSATRDLQSGIWRSNGHRLGTSALYEIPSKTISAFGYDPLPAAWIGDTLVIAGINTCELPWQPCARGIARSDGTRSGTWLSTAIPADWGSPSTLHNFGDRVLGSAVSGSRMTLYTASAALDDIDVLADADSGLGPIILTNAQDDPDFALVRCGTIASPNVCVLRPGGTSFTPVLPTGPCQHRDPRAVGAINGRAVFSIPGCGIGSSRVLWSSDGTAASTFIIPDVSPGFANGVVHGSHLFFPAPTASGIGLWKTDGNTAIHIPGPLGVTELMVSGAFLYFEAHSGGQTAVWRSDGTQAGTFALRTSASLLDLKTVADHLHWVEYENFQTTYWVSDGTVAGTSAVPAHPTLRPAGEIFALPEIFGEDSPQGWNALVTCDSAMSGIELCGIRADGSGLGLLADIAPGDRNSMPAEFRTNGRKVFLIADDDWHGRELFELRTNMIFRSGVEVQPGG